MHIIFAPDSFKGSASAVRITEILSCEAKKRFGDVKISSLPVADGGEGTIDALLGIVPGKRVRKKVTAPHGETVEAEYACLSDSTAVIEMAQCSGLTLVPKALRNPMYLTSYGLGEMIAHVLDDGHTNILIGLGGSATNDGGMGLLSALGAVFETESGRRLDGMGAELSKIGHIRLDHLHPGLQNARLTVISDVTNPLLGKSGATYIYGPQKGADEITLQKLENGMTHYADMFFDLFNIDISSFPGSGAAGGAGAALTGVLRADMKRGIDVVLDMAGFDALLEDADLVVTGEGRVDGQTVKYGKVASGIIERSNRFHVPVAVITGGMGPEAENLYTAGNAMIFPIENAPMTLEYAMANADLLIRQTAERLFWAFDAGMKYNHH
ncbi:MAG: glycerate kinase [Clostridia bacterium]|nr:glycerate kinase [Clostridia bacterium]MBQ4157669.1 glycerate kinase [Clostridia bacterium]